MDYSKILESVNYNKLVTSYEEYNTAKKKYRKVLRELDDIAKFIYAEIWRVYGSDYVEEFDGYMEDLGNQTSQVYLEDINAGSTGIVLYYEYELDHAYGDSEFLHYNVELSREQFEDYVERFKMSKETKKFNL